MHDPQHEEHSDPEVINVTLNDSSSSQQTMNSSYPITEEEISVTLDDSSLNQLSMNSINPAEEESYATLDDSSFSQLSMNSSHQTTELNEPTVKTNVKKRISQEEAKMIIMKRKLEIMKQRNGALQWKVKVMRKELRELKKRS